MRRWWMTRAIVIFNKYDEASFPSEQHTPVPRACLSVPQSTTAKDDGSPQTPLQVLPNLSLVMLHSLLVS